MNISKTPWLTKDVMTQIYEQQLWGTNGTNFYSGEGSHRTKIIQPYVKAISKFLKFHNHQLTVCDLGCGDFNIGKHFIKHTKNYIAVDIVSSLIDRNKKQFKAKNLEFRCLDISKDNLPKAGCVIIRQVLQHLSNTEIQLILKKLKAYKYIIVTEHLPIGDFKPNLDKTASQGIRIKQNSGVDIIKAPFNFKVKSFEVLDEVKLDNYNGIIRTTLYTI